MSWEHTYPTNALTAIRLQDELEKQHPAICAFIDTQTSRFAGHLDVIYGDQSAYRLRMKLNPHEVTVYIPFRYEHFTVNLYKIGDLR